MGGDQEGAIDPPQDHIEESDHNTGRDGSNGYLDQEPDQRPKGHIEADHDHRRSWSNGNLRHSNIPPAPYYRQANVPPQEESAGLKGFSLTLVAGGRHRRRIAQDLAEWVSGHIGHLDPQQRGDGWSDIQIGDVIEPNPGTYAVSPGQEDGLHLHIVVEIPVGACMRGSTFATRKATREGIARLRRKQQVRRLIALLRRW